MHLVTKSDLKQRLRDIGISAGDTTMVHSSLRGIGFLINGPRDIIDAILETIGPTGTVIFPAFSGHLTDPVDWRSPSVPVKWQDRIRKNMLPFDKNLTPTRSVGILCDAALQYPDVERSNHPTHSISALGKHAREIVADHPLHSGQGTDSPYERIYKLGPKVLLFGIGLEACTLIHMAEFRAYGSFVQSRRSRVRHQFADGTDFVEIDVSNLDTNSFERLRPMLAKADCLMETFFGPYRITSLDGKAAVDMATAELVKDKNFFDI
jgi:aminoglycoside 3-N-acetyltransferase